MEWGKHFFFFLLHFLSSDELLFDSCLTTHPKSPLLPSYNPEETSSSSYFQLNTPIYIDNGPEREWGHFKMGGNGGWVLVKGWIEAGSHVVVTPTCTYRVYLKAAILKQTLSGTTPKKTPPPRPPTHWYDSDDRGELCDYQATTHLHMSKINRQLEEALLSFKTWLGKLLEV